MAAKGRMHVGLTGPTGASLLAFVVPALTIVAVNLVVVLLGPSQKLGGQLLEKGWPRTTRPL